MRLTASILALLIIILSCLPCADIDAMPTSKPITEKVQVPAQDHKHNEKDLCSPFCHCSCCSTYSVVNVPIHLPEKVEFSITPIYTSILSDEVIEISLPIWQPPRLG